MQAESSCRRISEYPNKKKRKKLLAAAIMICGQRELKSVPLYLAGEKGFSFFSMATESGVCREKKEKGGQPSLR